MCSTSFGSSNMGVHWLLLCVLYQTVIPPFGAFKLPLDLEAIPPTKSSQSLLEDDEFASLSSPIYKKLRDILLEYFKFKYLTMNQPSTNMDENLSPLVTTTSRVLAAPKVEARTDDLPNILPESGALLTVPSYKPDVRTKENLYGGNSLSLSNKVKLNSLPNSLSPTVQYMYGKSNPYFVSIPSITSLPVISLESLQRNIEGLAGGSNYANYLTYLPLYSLAAPVHYNKISLPDVSTPAITLTKNPVNSGEGLRLTSPNINKIGNCRSNALNTYAQMSLQGLYSPGLTPLSVSSNANPNLFITQRVPKVPLMKTTSANRNFERQSFYNRNPPIQARNNNPLCEQFLMETILPLSYLKNFDSTYSNPGLNLGNVCYSPMSTYDPEANQFDSTIPTFDYSTSRLTVNKLDTNIDLMNSVCSVDSSNIDCNSHENIIEDHFSFIRTDTDLIDIPNDTQNWAPVQKISDEIEESDITSLSLPTDLCGLDTNENVVLPILNENILNTFTETCSSPTINYTPKLPPTAVFPAAYINISPTCSLFKSTSNAISSINNIVSSITQSILTPFISGLTSATMKSKTPIPKVPSNCYNTLPLNLESTQILINSPPSRSPYTHMTLPLNTFSETVFPPLEQSQNSIPTCSLDENRMPSFGDDIATTPINLYSDDVTTTDVSSVPLKVNLLPPTSFVDYLPTQPSPSTLPLPTLPTYLSMAPPITTKPLDRKAKSIEKLLKVLFLAEFLHREGYIDWDALDTVLAMLSAC